MINCTAALKAHLAQPYQTTCTMWLIIRTDGTVLSFTDLDKSLPYNFESFCSAQSITIPEIVGTGLQTYTSATGYIRTDIAGAEDLSVDNLELDGILSSPSITEASLHQGLWDYAFYAIFMVNWKDLTNTMGALVQRVGHLGEVTVERNTFKAELRGRTQAYSRVIGELTQPGCRAQLFDTRCKVNPATYTFTSTITGINASFPTVLYDTARTEPGPSGGIAIVGITNANPGIVTVADGTSFANGESVTLSGIVGPALLNANTVIASLSGNTFSLGIDTSNTSIYPAYVSGGTVTPLGSDSGYFDYGVITFTGGLNNGLSEDIRSYVPGQFTLGVPFPFAVAVTDPYSVVAGCDKSSNTCKTRFSNILNFRGEPFLPGLDKIVQIGKQ